MKWFVENNVWRLSETPFEIQREDGEWAIYERGSFLATTQYAVTAKSLCERLAKNGDAK